MELVANESKMTLLPSGGDTTATSDLQAKD
jgi:hypothetical protein